MESKYLESFKKLKPGQLPLRGTRLLVELLPKPAVKSAGGIFIESGDDMRTSTKENQADLVLVLATGPGYYDDETKEDVPMDIHVGDVLLVSRMGLKLYSQFPGLNGYTKETIALTKDSEAHANWPSIEAFKEYQDSLNS